MVFHLNLSPTTSVWDFFFILAATWFWFILLFSSTSTFLFPVLSFILSSLTSKSSYEILVTPWTKNSNE